VIKYVFRGDVCIIGQKFQRRAKGQTQKSIFSSLNSWACRLLRARKYGSVWSHSTHVFAHLALERAVCEKVRVPFKYAQKPSRESASRLVHLPLPPRTDKHQAMGPVERNKVFGMGSEWERRCFLAAKTLSKRAKILFQNAQKCWNKYSRIVCNISHGEISTARVLRFASRSKKIILRAP
jgi:hypothetical protein